MGGAWWQWRQACGDPHVVSWPSGEIIQETGNLLIMQCGDPDEPAGVVSGFEEHHRRVLSRPYPRRFPGRVTFMSDPQTQTMELEGTADLPAAPLEIWIPGRGQPTVSFCGLSEPHLEAIPGGWILKVKPKASSYTLTVSGHTE